LFTAEFDGERIWEIAQHLAKLLARVECPVSDSRGTALLKL